MVELKTRIKQHYKPSTMKTNQFIKKTIGAVMIAAAMMIATSSVFAQVKIGSNPTVIGSTNNLEVESSTGAKITADKTSGQLTVTTAADPVKFVGLQLTTSMAAKTLVADPTDGTVKYVSSPTLSALSAASKVAQTFDNANFSTSGGVGGTNVITFSASDIVLNTGAATLDANSFTIAENGIYDLYAHSNFIIFQATWTGTQGYIMLNLAIERQIGGTGAWVPVAGSRTPYLQMFIGATVTCQTSSVVSLLAGDKLRVALVKSGNDSVTGSANIGTSGVGNGVPFTKSVKIVKLN